MKSRGQGQIIEKVSNIFLGVNFLILFPFSVCLIVWDFIFLQLTQTNYAKCFPNQINHISYMKEASLLIQQ